jgi:hypothetical protein
MRDIPHQGYNKWPLYAGAFVLACLVFAALPLCRSCQGLGKSAVDERRHCQHGADAAGGRIFPRRCHYYRNRAPSRGEVAVYVHPKSTDLHYIKRIVAVEGDRIAIKGGRTIVNGMAVEEPYVETTPPRPMLADTSETRGRQRGHAGGARAGRARLRAGRQPRYQRGQRDSLRMASCRRRI